MSENEPLDQGPTVPTDPIVAALHGEPCDECYRTHLGITIMSAIGGGIAAVLVFALCSREVWESARG